MFMLAAMASFACGDAIMKTVSADLPLSQILVVRGCFAIAGFWAIAIYFQMLRPVSVIFQFPFLLRTIGEIVATLFFLTALFNMPMANAAAIMQALPLTVSLGAAWFLGEAIGWRRVTAILVGLVGVLLIVKPGMEGFTIFSVFCLVAVIGTTTRDLATRRIPADIPGVFISLVTVSVITVSGLLLMPFQDWQPVGMKEIASLAFASLFLMSGFLSIISAMRAGEVAVVTPFRYSVLIFAVILGYILFDELPGMLTIIGSVIVVASGLYTLYRETKLSRRSRKKFS